MRIIDFRGRPATSEFAAYGGTRVFGPSLAARGYKIPIETVEDHIARMDRLDIERSVVTGRDIETTWGYRIPNEYIADLVRQYPDRLVGFAGIDPNKGMDALREVNHSFELGLRGVSLDPYLHKRPLNDKKYYPIYARCTELGIPVAFTTGSGRHMPETLMGHGAPSLIDEVATDFPQLIIVASHGCWPYVLEAIALLGRHHNVYLELSGFEMEAGTDLFAQAANRGRIADKLMFASAYPLRPVEMAIETAVKFGYNDEVLPQVLYENAARLLSKIGA